MSVAWQPALPDVVVSGACDNTAKLWDLRQSGSGGEAKAKAGACVASLTGHMGDINAVALDTCCDRWTMRSA